MVGANEDVEVGEVGGGGKDLAQGKGGVSEGGEIAFFPGKQDGVGGGAFEIGGKGAGEGEEFFLEEDFVVGIGAKNAEVGTAGEGACGGDAGMKVVLFGGGVEGGEEGLLAGGGGFVAEGEGVVPELRLFQGRSPEREGGEMESEGHGVGLLGICCWLFVYRRVAEVAEKHGDGVGKLDGRAGSSLHGLIRRVRVGVLVAGL